MAKAKIIGFASPLHPGWAKTARWFKFHFTRLFGRDQVGEVWQADVKDAIYTTSTGSVNSDIGDPVGRIEGVKLRLDAPGIDLVQATAPARPLWGRMPRGGVRNMLGFTEDVSRWGDSSGEVSLLGGIDDPDGGETAIRLTGVSGLLRATVPVQVPYGQSGLLYTTRLWLRAPNSPSSIRIYFANVLTETITPTTDWVEYDVTVARAGTANPTFFQLRVGGEGEVVDVWHPQSELGSSPTPYQRVTSPYDITESGVPSTSTAYFDLADDALSATLPAISGGTVVLAGEKGVWIDDGYDFAGGTWTYGPSSYPGGPAGIIAQTIGNRFIGGFVIDRALTEAEKSQVVAYWRARGAPGVWELGPELVTNGDFSDGLEGWVPTYGGGSITPVETGLQFVKGPTGNAIITQNTGLPTASYILAEWVVASGATGARLVSVGGVSTGYISGSGKRAAVLGATLNSNLLFAQGGDTGSQCTLESISLRKLELMT